MATFLSLPERIKFRTTIKKLTDFNESIEKALRKRNEIPLHIRQKVFEMTNCTDMGEAYDALLEIKEQTQLAYLSQLKDMAPKSLSAFSEYMNPDEPPAPHHEFLIDHLEAVESSDLLRLMLSMPPGHGKPITVDAPVMMADGSFKILGDVEVGDSVITHKGRPRTVTAVHKQGELETWHITLKSGRVIRCAADHPFLTGRGWIECQHLVTHDVLIPVVTDAKPTNLYTDEEFSLAGMVCGSGQSLQKEDHPRKVMIYMDSTQGFYLQDIIRIAAEANCEAAVAFSARKGQRENRAYFPLTGNETLRRLGLIDAVLNQTIPRWVSSGSADQIMRFIVAYWRASYLDYQQQGQSGKARIRGTFFSTTEKAESFEQLLWLIGINGCTFPYDLINTKKQLGLNLYADKEIVFKARIKLCADEVSKLHEAYTDMNDECVAEALVSTNIRMLTADRVVSVTNTRQMNEMRCLTVAEDESFTVFGLCTHNSTYASHLFAAWYLGRNPKKRFLQAGHTQKFCEDELGKRARNYVNDEKFSHVFPDVKVSNESSAAATWAIAKYNGKYMVRAVGQGISGIRGHIGAVDDPYPALIDAESQSFRDKVYNWYNSDFKTRLLPNSPICLVTTRWHPDDLVGRLLEHEKKERTIPFTVINMPIFCAKEGGDELGRKYGERLWDWYDDSYIADIKAGMSPRIFASLYQGQPVPESGNMLNPQWIRHYTELPKGEKFTTISVDTANKATERADYTVILVWYQYGNEHYLVDTIRRKIEYNEIRSTIELHARKHKANVIIIEDAGTGAQYAIECNNTEHVPPCPVIAIKPHGSSKEFKFDASLPQWESGNVFLPERADWLATYESELLSFPVVKNDDQADATAQYLLYRRPKPEYGTVKMGATKTRSRLGGAHHAVAPETIVRKGAFDMSTVADA